MILIFTIDHEYSTGRVIDWLNKMGEEVVRLNADDDTYKFEKINEAGIFFKNSHSKRTVNLCEAKSCWWRRRGISQRHFFQRAKRRSLVSGDYDLTSLINGRIRNDVFTNESDRLIEYIYKYIYQNCSINLGRPPLFNLNRLVVLDIAKRNGLHTPPFNVLTDKRALSDAVNLYGDCVTKAISNGIMEQISGCRYYTYTELLGSDFFTETNNSEIKYFPSLISKKIEKRMEIRSFYIDGAFYSMAIFSQNDKQTSVDFRKYNNIKPNKNEPYKLPEEIEFKLINVFKDINLNCGSIDLIVDKKGNYIFLEINPVGQYNMVSEPCNYNLDNLIAKYLIYGKNETN
jgi:ATP-GRASP peptide maturase of grasp-with-spasm system